jgi:hypothetical protein
MSHLGMVSIRRFWNAVLEEPIPDCFDALLKRLPDCSDGSGGGVAGSGVTRSGSSYPSSVASLSIHPTDTGASHNRAQRAANVSRDHAQTQRIGISKGSVKC